MYHNKGDSNKGTKLNQSQSVSLVQSSESKRNFIQVLDRDGAKTEFHEPVDTRMNEET